MPFERERERWGVLGFSPTSVIDGGGAQHIRWGKSSPIRLIFWVELDPKPYMLLAPVDLGPMGSKGS